MSEATCIKSHHMPTMSEQDYDSGMLKWTRDSHEGSVLHREQQATKESWNQERRFLREDHTN